MHFTVLSAISLPQDIVAAVRAVPVDDVANYAARKLLLKSLGGKKPLEVPRVTPPLICQERWECFAEGLVADLLAPYNENTTNIAYMEFDDRTEEGRKTYEQSGVDCVRTPDGRIITCISYEFCRRYELYNGKIYRRWFGPLHHRKLTKKAKKYRALPNYPFRKLYPTFDAFMIDYWGCEKGSEPGQYGYYFNASGEWDWWQIGGRWPFRFLVKDDCATAVTGEMSGLFRDVPQRHAPDGYRWVAGARKGDIAWDVMREFIRSQCIEQFRQYEEWFRTGEIPKEHTSGLQLVSDGLVQWGDYLYRKGEDLEHRLYSMGLSDQHPYPINTFACVDKDGWHDQGWGTHDSDDAACQGWYKEVAEFIEKQPDDVLFVSVDCHT